MMKQNCMKEVSRWTFFLLMLLAVNCENLQELEHGIRTSLFQPPYDKSIRPMGTNRTGPVVINVNMMIRGVQSISDEKMEYDLMITFRQQWNDDRLTYDNRGGRISNLSLREDTLLWTPDPFFKNEKRIYFHDTPSPNSYVRIYPDGGVLSSKRLSLTLSCPMDRKLFPFDRVTCQILVASYAFNTNDLVYLWRATNPVQVTSHLHVPIFTLEKFIIDYCNSQTKTGKYSCLRVDLVFKREFSYYMSVYFIPSAFLIFLTWISFWLDQEAIQARLALIITSILTMFCLVFNITKTFPTISYSTAFDVWNTLVIIYLFVALIECVCVNSCFKSRKRSESVNQSGQLKESDAISQNECQNIDHKDTQMRTAPSLKSRMKKLIPKKGQWTDAVFILLFPLTFILFNILYWNTYLYNNDEEYGSNGGVVEISRI